MARTKPGAKVDKVEPQSEVVRALRKVCEEDDSRRVVDLLAGGSVTAADATACLKRSWRLEVPVIRLLLEHGADPAACGTTRYMQTSLELMKLLVEFGYDIKINGHWVLQCVTSGLRKKCGCYMADTFPGIMPTPASPSTGCLTRASMSAGLTTNTRMTAGGTACAHATSLWNYSTRSPRVATLNISTIWSPAALILTRVWHFTPPVNARTPD
jgi:hypothetical protein